FVLTFLALLFTFECVFCTGHLKADVLFIIRKPQVADVDMLGIERVFYNPCELGCQVCVVKKRILAACLGIDKIPILTFGCFIYIPKSTGISQPIWIYRGRENQAF